MGPLLAASGHDHASFELTFRPSTALASVVRRFVSELCEQVLRDPDVAARLALAAHELVENAAKYSREGESLLRVDLDPSAGVGKIVTRNRSEPRHIDALRARFAEMDAATDDAAYYQTLLRRSTAESSGSGIGLARMRCEADLELRLDVQGDLVGIYARSRALPGRLG